RTRQARRRPRRCVRQRAPHRPRRGARPERQLLRPDQRDRPGWNPERGCETVIHRAEPRGGRMPGGRVARAEHKSTHRIRLAAAAAAALLALTTAAAQIAGDEAAPSPQTPTSSEDRALGVPRNAPGAPDAEARRTASGGSGAWIGQTLLSLGGVLGLAVVGAGALRLLARSNGSLRASLGAGGRAPAGIMEILGRYPVGRGATLVLLKLDRRIL